MNATKTTTARNKETVADFLTVFSSGNVVRILECLTDDATWWVSGSIEGLSGEYSKSELGLLLVGATSLYKSRALKIVPEAMLAESDDVAVEAVSYAELLNGRIYSNRYHFLFRVAGGRIKSVKEYMDTKHAYDTFIVPA